MSGAKKKAASKPEPIKAFAAYGCNLCPVDKEGCYGFEADTSKKMADHLREEHQVEVSKVAREVMKLHLNADRYYRSVKAWTMPDGREVATKVVVTPKQWVEPEDQP